MIVLLSFTGSSYNATSSFFFLRRLQWLPAYETWSSLFHVSRTFFYTYRLPPLGLYISTSVQFSSVAQLCPTLCDPMNCSTPGLPLHHQLPEFTQTHVQTLLFQRCRPLPGFLLGNFSLSLLLFTYRFST